jgi:predicted XRE-type DNA-binding protein
VEAWIAASGRWVKVLMRPDWQPQALDVLRRKHLIQSSTELGIPVVQQIPVVYKIDTIMKSRRMKQREAAELFGVRQPDVSKMLHGEFRQFSVERLLGFLVKLDQDVEIVVRPHRDRDNAPALRVA